MTSTEQASDRRADLLGVHSLDHFSLTVPDLAVADGFYRDFGLGVRERGNALDLRTDGSEHRWGRIGEGSAKSLSIIIKSDVQGSYEAMAHALPKLSTNEVKVNIVHCGVGGITE